MLYLLYHYFHINLFHYISFRSGIAFFVAFFLTLWLIPKFIAWAKSKASYQPIYELAPSNHQQKSQTPTMGGVVFITAAVAATLLSANILNPFIIGALLNIALFGVIGFIDDFGKIQKRSNSSGLLPKQKFILQLLFGLVISFYLLWVGFPDTLYIPFYKYPLFHMHLFAPLFWTLVIVATSNAVNLTDGLDGLATVPSIFALASLGTLSYISGHAILSHYLFWPYIEGVGEVTIVAAAFIGALIGFLWYNCHPAQLFMGDSGSLTLGALIGYLAILAKSEILLLLIGFVFVLEAMSVIIQVASFKTRGKRVFLMAPIHHHFEKKKWAESKIIVRFWIIALITNLLALITLKIR